MAEIRESDMVDSRFLDDLIVHPTHHLRRVGFQRGWVHKHERTVPHDMGGDSPESGTQPQRNPGGAETENAVQPEQRNEGAAADGDIHSGAELGMGYDQELRELADSGSSVEEHDSGTEHDNPFNDDGSLTETAEYDNEVDFSGGGSASFLSGDQYSLFDTAPPAAETSKDQNAAQGAKFGAKIQVALKDGKINGID